MSQIAKKVRLSGKEPEKAMCYSIEGKTDFIYRGESVKMAENRRAPED